jgi:NhaP-type Na+/H+ or K+/H+ antiporter
MVIDHAWLVGFGVTALLLLLGATSGLVNSKLWVSEPLVCAAFGVAVGPLGLGLLSLDPVHNPQAHVFLREAARITLAIAVLAAAIRLPQGWLRRNWRGLGVALGPGMVLMWAAGALVTAASFALPWRVCALVGAIIAPTDPVLSAPVVGGELARRAVPAELRHAITAESGINDGLAGPIVMLPVIALSTGGTWHAIGLRWLLHAVLWDVGTALLLGGAAGYVARRLMQWAARQEDAEHGSLLSIALALALATMTGLQAIGGNGVLGAFVAGAVLNDGYEAADQEQQDRFNEAVTRFFDLPIMILLGVAAPWAAWSAMGWHAVAFVAGILLLRRMPAWLLLRHGMTWAQRLSANLFAGWFGPIGAAALFYALTAQDSTGLETLWPIVSLAAAASVVAHGITGTPVTAFLEKKESTSFLKKRSKKLLT